MNPALYERLWRVYVAPKGRLGNALQGAVLKAVETARLAPRIARADTIILVHSQGKVGSSAMYDSMAETPPIPGALVFQTHVIRSPHDPREIEDRKKITPRRTAYTTDLLHPLLTRADKGGKKIVDVSAVRDPIDRMISDFFQNLERYTPDRQYPKPGQHRVDDYLNWFRERFDVFRSSDWFDEQFCELLGLNLYIEPFDQTAGYQIVRGENVVAGVIRFDRISDAWSPYSISLTGTDVHLDRTNESSAKAYGHVYPEFKKRLRLDPTDAQALYDLPYVRHFYTETERQAAVAKWTSSPCT